MVGILISACTPKQEVVCTKHLAFEDVIHINNETFCDDPPINDSCYDLNTYNTTSKPYYEYEVCE